MLACIKVCLLGLCTYLVWFIKNQIYTAAELDSIKNATYK